MKCKFLWCIFMALSIFTVTACSSKNNMVKNSLNSYIGAWTKGNYDLMYSKMDKESKSVIAKKDFVSRYNNIYSGIEAKNINVKIDSSSDIKYEDGVAKVPNCKNVSANKFKF